MEFVEQIEAQGGYIAAQHSGWIRNEVEKSAERWREEVNSGERRIVGLNTYQVEEEPQQPIFQVDPEVERVAVERIRELRESRDHGRHEKAIGEMRKAAEDFARNGVADLGDHGLMDTAIEAARADATTGEMMGVLKETLGWAAPHEF